MQSTRARSISRGVNKERDKAMKVKAVVSRIDWDTDGKVVESLPQNTTINMEVDERDNLDDEVVNKLSDEYGYCVNSFAVEYYDEDGEYIDTFGDYVNSVEAQVS